jgi:imidazolonepropionase-like amidohydrolase
MRTTLLRLAPVLVSAILSTLMTTVLLGQPPDSARNNLALAKGTIYVSPTDEPIRDGVVLVQGNKITAVGRRGQVKIPPGTQVLDCSGLTITAGFWNSHVHFFERKWANVATIPAPELTRQLQDMLTRYGFTSVFDLGSMWENTRQLHDRIESGEVAGPRIRSTGEALVAPHAVPPDTILRMLGFMSFPAPEIGNAEQATAAARKLIEEGVDGIKIHLQSPPPPNPPFPEAAIPAAVNEAHRAGKPTFVHPNTGADVLLAVRAGVDVVAHTTPRSGPWDETILTAMKEHRVALTPTLTLWKYSLRHDRISTQEQLVDTAVGQLRAWVQSEGTVLFGTDLGAIDYNPSDEYALMAKAGMTFPQILASLTTAPAELFGDGKLVGRVAPGFQADLVVLRDDPAKKIGALTAVQQTLRAGKVVYRTGE